MQQLQTAAMRKAAEPQTNQTHLDDRIPSEGELLETFPGSDGVNRLHACQLVSGKIQNAQLWQVKLGNFGNAGHGQKRWGTRIVASWDKGGQVGLTPHPRRHTHHPPTATQGGHLLLTRRNSTSLAWFRSGGKTVSAAWEQLSFSNNGTVARPLIAVTARSQKESEPGWIRWINIQPPSHSRKQSGRRVRKQQ